MEPVRFPRPIRVSGEAAAVWHGSERQASTIAFRALIVFSVLYYARPEDIIPGLSHVPLVKIAGGIAVLALVFSKGSRVVKKLPVEIKLLFGLLLWLIFTIPFAWWRGGAFDTVFNRFSKGVIVALLVSMVVCRMENLRKLFVVQAICLTLMTAASIVVNRDLRMSGVLGGVFENPNDLAINIALNFPLAFAFLLLAKGLVRKLLWAAALFILTAGLVLTYSRSGFLAMLVAGAICLWQFGFKGRRLHLVGVTFLAVLLLAVAAPLLGLYPKVWTDRMATIVTDSPDKLEDSYDNGSKEARQELLHLSLTYMKRHPIVGVGPGNFAAVSGTWRVAHNTYTELGAEAGLPALGLFLLVLIFAFRNLRRVGKSRSYREDMTLQVFTGALWASFGAYLLGAAFSDTQYELFPYFIVAYTTALYHLACVFPQSEVEAKAQPHYRDRFRGLYARSRPEFVKAR
jgi:O-antigen ligase